LKERFLKKRAAEEVPNLIDVDDGAGVVGFWGGNLVKPEDANVSPDVIFRRGKILKTHQGHPMSPTGFKGGDLEAEDSRALEIIEKTGSYKTGDKKIQLIQQGKKPNSQKHYHKYSTSKDRLKSAKKSSKTVTDLLFDIEKRQTTLNFKSFKRRILPSIITDSLIS
jgi:hypothetical protein